MCSVEAVIKVTLLICACTSEDVMLNLHKKYRIFRCISYGFSESFVGVSYTRVRLIYSQNRVRCHGGRGFGSLDIAVRSPLPCTETAFYKEIKIAVN